MVYEFNGKKIRIPDGDILRLKSTMKISAEEAVKIWLEDEGILHNEEQENLCKKAKDSGIMRTIHGASSKTAETTPTQRERTKKENPTKGKIIAEVAKLLTEFADSVNVTNPEKLIEFTMNGNDYKLDLTQKRKKKE